MADVPAGSVAEPQASQRPTGCLTEFVLIVSSMLVTGAGFFWLVTIEPAFTSMIFGSVVRGDLIRAGAYGSGLLLVFGLIALLLHSPRFALWRGIALSFAVMGGYSLLAGGLLALDRSIEWPEWTGIQRALLVLVYAAGLVIAGRRYFLSVRPDARIWFGLALGIGVSGVWAVVGALGTPREIAVAFIDALAYGLLSAVMISLVVAFDREMPFQQPFRTALSAGIVYAANSFALFAARGWALQGLYLCIAFLPLGLIAGVLLTYDERPDPRRTWWNSFAFFFAALFLPLAFTKGIEGDIMPFELLSAWGPAVLIEPAAALVLALLLMILRPWIARLTRLPVVTAGMSAAALAAAAAVYAALGQPGIQPDTFFVVMADQADTSFAEEITDRDERVTTVYETLTQHALETQVGLRTMLDQKGVTYTPYYLMNGIKVEGSTLLRAQIAQRDDIALILNSQPTRPLPDWATDLALPSEPYQPGTLALGIDALDAERVWEEFDVTGEGIIVGLADSGVDWQHPALHGQYLGEEGNHDYTWFDPWDGTREPTDVGGHGTHTLGTILGQDGIGAAPGARWIACRNLAHSLGNPAYYLDCMQFLFAPFPQNGDPFTEGDPLRGAHLTNNSWSCPPFEGCDASTLSTAVEHLRNAGQMFIASAGNEGPACDTIWSPANADAAFTVGAINPQTGEIATFSSRGPILGDGSGRIKPDITAPGQEILSSVPGGGYASLEGTSMAGPHVAGLVALMWSADPSLIGDIDATEAIIYETAHYTAAPDLCGADTGEQNNVYGYGSIDAFAAVERVLNGSD